MRKIHQNIPLQFEPYEWKVVETSYSQETNKRNETIFTVANGYLGVRGFFEEGFYGDIPTESDAQTMINGVYEYYDYHHIWCRPGFPERFHSIVSNVNPLDISVYIDGERVTLKGNVSCYERTLNMDLGTVTRTFVYQTESGKRATLTYERFASQTVKELLCDRITVTPEQNATVKIVTVLKALEGTLSQQKEEIGAAMNNPFVLTDCGREDGADYITYRTKRSGFAIACAVKDVTALPLTATEAEESRVQAIYEAEAEAGKPIVFDRFAALSGEIAKESPKARVKNAVLNAAEMGYEAVKRGTTDYWKEYWSFSDIRIEGDPVIQQGIRFGLFMINQSAGKDGKTNISANGLTGTAYSGHTFWDTEIFMTPMFLYAHPEIVKSLLMYRYNILPKAKERAAQMDDVGALFSWNSINGEECGHVFEAATAQYHINNDVFFAIFKYFEATGDFAFMRDYGIEILLEISKCMAHRGSFIERKGGRFCINCVCGPDEYNPVVDNNLYTNFLTRKQLYFTLEMVERLQREDAQKLAELKEKCGIDDKELALFKEAADKMYLAYDEEEDIYMQDDNFIYKDPIDIDSIPVNKLPLLTNLHPLNLWRYKVLKQADIVLLTFICSDGFTPEMRKKIFDYYEPLTIHDSSLSAGIHSIVACDIGYPDEAYGYLKQACRMDLDNVNRNTCYGIHAACMGSCWMMIVNGYAGMRAYDGMLHFKPYLPESWQGYSFRIRFKGAAIEVKVAKEGTTYVLLEGESLTLMHNEREITLLGVGNSITV
ncbi:MAG: glycoside hydrolase family 65 protein [Clostridia bacterium]|nr:glycoside hydrolase family 65 protein [Clostridia bacterium]